MNSLQFTCKHIQKNHLSKVWHQTNGVFDTIEQPAGAAGASTYGRITGLSRIEFLGKDGMLRIAGLNQKCLDLFSAVCISSRKSHDGKQRSTNDRSAGSYEAGQIDDPSCVLASATLTMMVALQLKGEKDATSPLGRIDLFRHVSASRMGGFANRSASTFGNERSEQSFWRRPGRSCFDPHNSPARLSPRATRTSGCRFSSSVGPTWERD